MFSGLDGVALDSIAVPGQPLATGILDIGRFVAFPNSRWMAVGIQHRDGVEWVSVNRNGRIGERLPLRPTRLVRASADALWISTMTPGTGSDLRYIVRIPFDARTGRFSARQDTIKTHIGDQTSIDVTPDGATFVFEEGTTAYSGWALSTHALVHGLLPEERRLLTATGRLDFEISPDGRKILVGRYAGPATSSGQLWGVLPFSGGRVTPIAGEPSLGPVVWTDSATVAVRTETSNGTALALLDVNTGVRRNEYVVADSPVVEAVSLPVGGWVWRVDPRGVKVHRPGEPGVRTLHLPEGYPGIEALSTSPDGKRVAFVGRAANRDSARLNVMSLSDGAVTAVKTVYGGAAFAHWLSDGSMMLIVWENPDSGLTLYRLRESGETISIARVSHPVWSFSVSADMRFAALTVRDYHGDASISRVVRH
jgi:hypothetical protein